MTMTAFKTKESKNQDTSFCGLSAIMNDLAQKARVGDDFFSDLKNHHMIPAPHSLMDCMDMAFDRLNDPITESLYRQYKDHASQFQKLRSMEGMDGAMCSIAREGLIAARNALKLRMNELRENKITPEASYIYNGQELLDQMQMQNQKRQQKEQKAVEKGRDDFFMALFFVMVAKSIFQNSARHLSVALAFRDVACEPHYRVAAA
jgi:hypothetical protein